MYSDCNTGRKTSLYCNRHGKSCYSCNVVRYSRGRCNHCMFPRSERGSDWKQFGKRSDMSRGEERIHPEISVQERAELIPMDVPPEVWIGRELRRIADDFTVYHQTGRARNQRPPNNQIRRLLHWISTLFRQRINGV
ncbi:uncharacterized protein LOC127574873 isoform X5 [Pristis pectinata]|uniref:uncharacterized protein LOC127574873 isoform X5 n=1 Tax=Pristis pectinata TaxID=685728 RepID=UPI00223C9CFC|nr:uncharacterized protein LOC127574873 isoform X5 [Pristis pectinata]